MVQLYLTGRGDGITQDEIVNDLGIDKGAVARIIKSLIDKGLIEKNKDEGR